MPPGLVHRGKKRKTALKKGAQEYNQSKQARSRKKPRAARNLPEKVEKGEGKKKKIVSGTSLRGSSK